MSNKRWFHEALTGPRIEKASGGRIKRFSPKAAAGMIGSWIVETGDPNLIDIDVVEIGNGGAGRGLSQYTGVRRDAYDRARASAIRNGQDVNSREWQFQYFVDEYLGKHDINGNSLSGWTSSFEKAPDFSTAADYAQYFTDTYFRPSDPHMERRRAYANEFMQSPESKPKRVTPANAPFYTNPNEVIQPSQGIEPGRPEGPGELILNAARALGLPF